MCLQVQAPKGCSSLNGPAPPQKRHRFDPRRCLSMAMDTPSTVRLRRITSPRQSGDPLTANLTVKPMDVCGRYRTLVECRRAMTCTSGQRTTMDEPRRTVNP